VARPFYGEALRLLGEGVATHEQIDRIVHFGGGFRMGPFQLMDLIGIDVNLAAMESMYKQTFGEARYRPHPIQVRMVAQNTLGRKTSRGFYDYADEFMAEPTLPETRQCNETIVLGTGSWAPGLGAIARRAGYKVQNKGYTQTAVFPKIAIAPASMMEGLHKQLAELDILMPANIPILCQTADVTLTEAATWIESPERLVGFDGLFFASGRVATLVDSPTLTPQARSAVEGFVTSLGRLPIWIEDSPALVLPRVVAMLINEAAFAVQEGVANADHIDLAMQLGVSYPRGLLAWAKEIGYAQVVDMLDHLFNEFKDDRYRAAYLLRRWARLELVKG